MAQDLPADQLDEALRALAHPARRAILRLTASHDVGATELAERLAVAPATASKHLKVLRKTKLVTLKGQGNVAVVSRRPAAHPRRPEQHDSEAATAAVTLGVTVEDLEGSIRKVVDLGRHVFMPPPTTAGSPRPS